MAEPAGRVDDHGQSATSRGIAVKGSPDVDVNNKAALRVCDKGTGETGPCTGQRWEPIMGSGTVEVNGKPFVRKTDVTQHFACGPGVMIDGSPNVEVGGPGVLPNQAKIDALVKYIYDEMMKNKDDPRTKSIKGKNDWGLTYPAMDEWKDVVGYKKPWDHKPDILKKFGEYSYDSAGDMSLPYDTWSNIHYGFVGNAAGFDDKTLNSGAGLAQWLNDNPGASGLDKAGKYADFARGVDLSGLDHPEDQEAIKIGEDLWKQYKKTGTLTEKDVKDAVMKKASVLGGVKGQVC